ncbi:MAG: hypothetical protein RLZZ324_248 [Candidatus Parcubacteria bacterium]|jgi:dUTPase
MAKKKGDSPHGKILVKRGPLAVKFGSFGPKREGDVGFDLICVEDTVIPPGIALPPVELPADTCVKLPPGTYAIFFPRSGTHNKFPTLLLCPAPIDNGYIGPIGPRFKNLGTEPITVPAGCALAQMLLISSVIPDVEYVTELPETPRGARRFGSTGH